MGKYGRSRDSQVQVLPSHKLETFKLAESWTKQKNLRMT
nr:MAG TPA: hypothetical protein [Caudoviricetes sp.]